MTRLRADRIAGIAADIAPLEVDADADARAARARLGLELRGDPRRRPPRARSTADSVAIAHLHHLHPMPANTGEVLRRFERVLVPEMNTGQLAQLLRAEFLVDVESYCKIEGQPLFAAELEREFEATAVDGRSTAPSSTLTKKDFQSDQETRWCPGCGDYAILAAVQG